MSVYRQVTLTCLSCGEPHRQTVAVSLNGPRVPEVVEQIIGGTFHRFDCPKCATSYTVDGPLIYTDFERKHWIGEFPLAWEGNWASLEQQPLDSFRRAMIDFAPRFIREESGGYEVRSVFGLEALAEKIALFEAGLDDHLVELVKLVVVIREGSPLHPATRPRFTSIDEDFIHFRLAVADTETAMVRVPRTLLDDLAGDEQWHTTLRILSNGPYVDLGRLMFDGYSDLKLADSIQPEEVG